MLDAGWFSRRDWSSPEHVPHSRFRFLIQEAEVSKLKVVWNYACQGRRQDRQSDSLEREGAPHVCTSPRLDGNVQLHGASYSLKETADGETNSDFSMKNGFGGRVPVEKQEKG